ncbi:putative SOS response-associated peptidase YedK [Duganella sp. SG902]|uniref:SOS response-associated peptidase family protein n=1 Tax=Duganella sp. SG902 TaxID=2587016 RepID=UPI00159E8919|nr:SOS response-associated peptidase family protein [Duganella sp. SG902]NVM77489.1 putative SOS response-associated peptidase YedK [Duganella sp. SG902]
MCVNYVTVSRQMCFDWFKTPIEVNEDWREEIHCDYLAPFIIHDEDGRRKGLLGGYGFVPQRRRPFKKLTEEERLRYERALERSRAQGKPSPEPPRIAMDTMNSRAEDVGSKVNYKRFWLQQQLCIVPAMAVFEPNWESGAHERWRIELASAEPFGMPGLWRSWHDEEGAATHTFTHFTLNADDHPLLNRFHRPGKEKRGLAILRPEHYDDWLGSNEPEFGRALIELFRPEELRASAAPRLSRGQSVERDGMLEEELPAARTPQLEAPQGRLFGD